MTMNGHDVEARYREALLAQPAVSKVTLADGQSVEVRDIYVDRTLLHEVVQKKPDSPEREITVKLPVELWPKLRDERVVLIEGPAGMGKSTLTKQLVRESETHHLIPIWISFRTFVASGLSLAEYLDQRYAPWLGLSDLRVPYRADERGNDRSLGRWCYDQWQSGLGVLILDGLDEVFRHEERVAAIKALPITGTGPTRPATILTSRPLSQSLPLQMAKVEVQGLTPAEQREFVKQYRASLQLTGEQVSRFTNATEKREQGRLQSLLARPGHLIQILTTYAKTNTLLDRETVVLSSLLESRLSITGRSGSSVEGDTKQKRQVLLSLALHLLACRQGQRHTRAQLLALIQQVLHELKQAGTPLFPLSQATALLNDLTRNSGLLIEVEPGVYEYETVIWLQHLTGCALANEQAIAPLRLTESKVLDFLNKKAWDPEWEPVLKSWVGNRENPFPLFTRLMNKRQDDLARHRLGLAGRCLREVRPESISQSQYRRLATRFQKEAFALWKANAKRNSNQLVTTSLGRAWMETKVGRTHLLALLQRPRSMRRAAVEACGGLGTAMAVPVQQVLVAQLADSDGAVRWAAVEAFQGLGTAMAVPVQQALVAQLVDSDRAVRWAAARAFYRLGTAMAVPVQQALVAQLADSDEDVHWVLASALSAVGAALADSVQQALVAQLADPDGEVRYAASYVLEKLGVALADSVQQALVAQLADPDGEVRSAAAGTLRGLGTTMPVSVQQALVARLTDQDGAVRGAAAWALAGLGAAMPVPVQEALLAQLADSDGAVRGATAWALAGLGAAMPVPVQQALVAQLADPDREVRRAAVETLGELGTVMPVSVQHALVARLTDPNEDVRGAAAWALAGLGAAMPVPVQQALVAQLADPDREVRSAAAGTLRGLGTTMPVPVQEALLAQLADSDGAVRWAAVEAFQGLGTTMPVPVQEALLAQLADSDRDVRRGAVEVLGGLGTVMPVAVRKALVARLADPDSTVRRAAVEALEKLGTAMPGSVQEALVSRLADPNEDVRGAAAWAISSAQQQGHRLFLRGTVVREGRLVSQLSATAPLSDMCHEGNVHAPAPLALPVFSRLPLTAL